MHGDLGQGAREQALRAFRTGKVDVLVATDVAARGIDVDDVTHVINYQCPEDEKTYVHRIGRTGRAGKTGVAVTLVDWDDMPRWKMVSDELGLGFAEPAETYSTSEHLYTDLAIAASATGRLPLAKRTRAGLSAEYVDSEGDVGGRKSVAAPAARTASPAHRSAPARPAAAPAAAARSADAATAEAAPTTGPEAVTDTEEQAAAAPSSRRCSAAVVRPSRLRTPRRRTPPRAER